MLENILNFMDWIDNAISDFAVSVSEIAITIITGALAFAIIILTPLWIIPYKIFNVREKRSKRRRDYE